jgi:hypothetical protein
MARYEKVNGIDMRPSEARLTKLFFRLGCPTQATRGISDGYMHRVAVVALESGQYRVVQGPAFGPGLGRTVREAEAALRNMAQ